MTKKKYKQILLLYYMEERELVINKIMSDCITEAELADEVIIRPAYEAIKELYNYAPDLVISFFPRDEYSCQLFTACKLLYECTWIAIPNEQYCNLTEDNMKIILGYNTIPRTLIDYCLFWGPDIKKYGTSYLLKKNELTSANRAKVFGYFPYELDRIRVYYKETYETKRIEEDKKKYSKVVMIVTGVMVREATYEEYIAQSAVDLSDDAKIQEIKREIFSNNYYTDKYIKMIRNLSEELKDTLFLVKLHPVDVRIIKSGEKLARFEGIIGQSNIDMITEANPISQYMDNVDVFIHYGSTSSMEAYVHKIPSILLSNDCDVYTKSVYGSLEYNGADQIIPVSDTRLLVEAIKNPPKIRKDSMVAKNAYSIMNYRDGFDYKPSESFINILKELDDGQILDKSDPVVNIILRGSHCKSLREYYFAELARALIKGNFEKVKCVVSVLIRVYKKLLE